ncbi:MAG TPA: thiamine-phosphate kinase [Dokdonella sp.]|nr:thiamine-phosphate kinase [Dokdonella sp.]
MAEFELINLLRQRCAHSRADVRLGIGDDAAVVCVPAGCELVVCTDTMVAGVHFPADTDPADIGWKALAVNLSDLAAMGATPAWATLALTLPSADADFVARFADGFFELARLHDVALIGGDTTRGPLTVTVTAHGFVPAGTALHRDGARAGDVVFVSGTPGDAAAGLRSLDEQPDARSRSRAALIDRLNRPRPRIATGISLRDLASACIDVSDGLLADLGHVAACSGIGMEVDAASVPASDALRECFDAASRRALQLAGGDDYELAFTVAEGDVEAMHAALAGGEVRVTRIGRVVAGSGVRVLDADGRPISLPRGGWEHFT